MTLPIMTLEFSVTGQTVRKIEPHHLPFMVTDRPLGSHGLAGCSLRAPAQAFRDERTREHES